MSSDPDFVPSALPALVAVPAPLLPRLTAECDTIPLPGHRSPLTDAALIIGTNATTVVALVWSRKTILALSRTIAELKATVGELKVQGQFGTRSASLDVGVETADEEIASFVSSAEAPAEIDPDAAVGDFTVFISYAHDNPEHTDLVRRFWRLLRENGVDAQIDLRAASEPRDWPQWTHQQIRRAKYVLLIASPAFKQRAEGEAPPGEGRGVSWEAQLLREMRYKDYEAALRKQLSVVLPGRSAEELPDWAGPTGNTHYEIEELTPIAARKLLEYLT
ncbi:SEFIR domain-containing protein [Amycolatopsis lexingtonensis]|uniref:SEFIR domain-containing protein n=1 Tax=Amycolatopsis lexingtonensis TaxID=218822 RepID=UPI003F71DF40